MNQKLVVQHALMKRRVVCNFRRITGHLIHSQIPSTALLDAIFTPLYACRHRSAGTAAVLQPSGPAPVDTAAAHRPAQPAAAVRALLCNYFLITLVMECRAIEFEWFLSHSVAPSAWQIIHRAGIGGLNTCRFHLR